MQPQRPGCRVDAPPPAGSQRPLTGGGAPLPRPAAAPRSVVYSTLHRAKEALCIAAGDAEWLKPSALALEACGESRLHLVSLLCSACSTFVLAPPRPWRGLVTPCLPRGARAFYSHMCVKCRFHFHFRGRTFKRTAKTRSGSRCSCSIAQRSARRAAASGTPAARVRRVYRLEGVDAGLNEIEGRDPLRHRRSRASPL